MEAAIVHMEDSHTRHIPELEEQVGEADTQTVVDLRVFAMKLLMDLGRPAKGQD